MARSLPQVHPLGKGIWQNHKGPLTVTFQGPSGMAPQRVGSRFQEAFLAGSGLRCRQSCGRVSLLQADTVAGWFRWWVFGRASTPFRDTFRGTIPVRLRHPVASLERGVGEWASRVPSWRSVATIPMLFRGLCSVVRDPLRDSCFGGQLQPDRTFRREVSCRCVWKVTYERGPERFEGFVRK